MKQADADGRYRRPKVDHLQRTSGRDHRPQRDAAKRPLVEAFIKYLWTDEAQKAFVKYHFRSVTNEAFNDENKEFAKIEQPFTVDMFGGWDKAYPDVIEKIFRDQVQNKK